MSLGSKFSAPVLPHIKPKPTNAGNAVYTHEHIIHVLCFPVMTNSASPHIVQYTQLVVTCTYLRQRTRIMQHYRCYRCTHHLYSFRESASSSTFPNGLAKHVSHELEACPYRVKMRRSHCMHLSFPGTDPARGCMCRCTRTQSRLLKYC
jgi:hypothetical protein